MSKDKQKKYEVAYEVNGQLIELNPSIIKQFITKGNAAITGEEAVNFMKLCQYSELNPFLNEAYLIKYSKDKPADMVVSKEAFMKRAHRQPAFNGYDAGVIVMKNDGEVIYKVGQFVGPNEQLVGGWSKVYRKDIDHPFRIEVALQEYSTGKSTWAKMPANMIRKVALVNGLREAFPEALGALYTEDEPGQSELNPTPREVERVDEVENKLLADFMPDIIDGEVIDEGKEKDKDNENEMTELDLDFSEIKGSTTGNPTVPDGDDDEANG